MKETVPPLTSWIPRERERWLTSQYHYLQSWSCSRKSGRNTQESLCLGSPPSSAGLLPTLVSWHMPPRGLTTAKCLLYTIADNFLTFLNLKVEPSECIPGQFVHSGHIGQWENRCRGTRTEEQPQDTEGWLDIHSTSTRTGRCQVCYTYLLSMDNTIFLKAENSYDLFKTKMKVSRKPTEKFEIIEVSEAGDETIINLSKSTNVFYKNTNSIAL